MSKARCPADAECFLDAAEVSNYMRLLATNEDNYAHLSNTKEYNEMMQV
jgi:hypothetical protein